MSVSIVLVPLAIAAISFVAGLAGPRPTFKAGPSAR